MSTGYVSEKFDASRFQDEIDKIISILQSVKDTIDNQTDVVWTNYNSPAEILPDIDKHIEQLLGGRAGCTRLGAVAVCTYRPVSGAFYFKWLGRRISKAC